MRTIVSAASMAALFAISACASSTSSTSATSASPDAGAPGSLPKVDTALYGLGSIATVWPNGIVPVCFADTVNNASLRAQIPTLLGFSWSWAANITFTGFGACAGGNEVTVVFQAGTNGVTDDLGYGARTVTLISNDTTPALAHFVYEVIHEFGHALGFAHEMKRPDNWNGGTILQCPVSAGNSPAQYALESGGIYLTPTYDVNSIMNYCDPLANKTTTLSAGDIAGVSRPDAYGLPYLSASPKAITVTQGDPQGVEVTLLTQNAWVGPQGPNGTVTPVSVTAASGLPSGVEAIPLTTDGTLMNIEASSSAPLGTFVVTFNGQGADGNGNAESHQALLQLTIVPPPDPSAPQCTPTSTCSQEYFPPGFSGVKEATTETLQTITASCKNPPTVMQENVDGSWVTLGDFIANAGYPQTATANVTDISASVGSVQSIRACVTSTDGVTTCDPPVSVTITDCAPPPTCTPTTTCATSSAATDGACGVVPDGCGNTITCPACATCQSLGKVCGTATIYNPAADTLACGTCGGDLTCGGDETACCPSGQVASSEMCCPQGESNSDGHCCATGTVWSTTVNACGKVVVINPPPPRCKGSCN